MNTLDRSPDDAAEETPVQKLDNDQVRVLLRKFSEDIAAWRAKLSLLMNTAVQYELDKDNGNDGLEVIASVASMPPSTLSKLLAGDYRPTPKTWAQIERILLLCQASRGVERVTAARFYFNQIVELSVERNKVLNRGVELARRTAKGRREVAADRTRSVTGQESSTPLSKTGGRRRGENHYASHQNRDEYDSRGDRFGGFPRTCGDP